MCIPVFPPYSGTMSLPHSLVLLPYHLIFKFMEYCQPKHHVPLMHSSIYNILSWEILYSVYTLYIHCTCTVHTVHTRAGKLKAKFLPLKLRCHSYFNVCTCALVQSKHLNVWHVPEI